MEGGVPLSAHPVWGGNSQKELQSHRDQTNWSKGLWGNTPCIFHLDLDTTALADGMVACWPVMKAVRMILDVNCLSLARMLYRAPTPQLMLSTVKAAWVMCSWHFILKEITWFYPSKYSTCWVTQWVTHLLCSPSSSHLRAVSEGVFLPGHSWSNHSPDAAAGR